MPTTRRNVINTKLTAKERETFAGFGRDKKQIDDVEERLKKESWTFWSRASELYMTLTTGSTIIYEGGKQRTQDEASGCKFTNNIYDTSSREIALNIFLSDLYWDGSVKEIDDHVADEAQAKYDEFKTAVLSDATNRDRLKEDFKDDLAAARAEDKETEKEPARV